MAVTRRTGLGAILGGMFSGPQVAKAAASQMMSAGTTKDPYLGYPEDAKMNIAQIRPDDPLAAFAKREAHKASLIKQAKGELEDWQEKYVEEHKKIHAHRIPLKSVSKSYKQIMRAKQEEKRAREHFMKEARQSLLNIFKESI